MSISNETVKQIFTGNGSNKNFAIPFDHKDNTTVRVVLRDESVTPAVETLQVVSTNYTLTGDPATEVIMNVAPPSTSKLLIVRSSPDTQVASFPASGLFPAAANELSLDNAVRQIQETNEKTTRALLLRETSGLSNISMPQPEADLFLKWNSTADGIEYGSLSTTVASLATQAEAEAGTDNTAYMSPLRVQQKITSDLATEAEARAGTNATQFMTPARVNQAIESIAITDAGAMSNVGYATSVNLSALTIDLKTSDGSTDPSATNVSSLAFRSATSTEGAFFVRPIVSALSITVPSGATLGHRDATAEDIYLYALDNLGTVELGVCSGLLDEGVLHTSTTISSGSDVGNVLYATTGASNLPIRLLGKMTSTQTTAGTYASAMSNVMLNHPYADMNPDVYKESACSALTNTVTADTYVSVTGMSLDLEVGTWQVGFDVSMLFIAISLNPNGAGNFMIADSSASTTPIGSLNAGFDTSVNSAESGDAYQTIAASRTDELVVTSPITIIGRVRCGYSAANAITRVLSTVVSVAITDPDNQSVMWARRIRR